MTSPTELDKYTAAERQDMIDAMERAALRTVDHLYKIDGTYTPEQYQAISALRQLINETHDPKRLVTNQFIYDTLKEIL